MHAPVAVSVRVGCSVAKRNANDQSAGAVSVTESMQIVCLANSRKLSGRCVAGREWSADGGTGRWIRFVSERENQEVSEYERQYEDGSDPGILDIIEVPVLSPQPEGYQTENWLLDPDYYWEKAGVYSSFDLPDLIDPVEPLWIDGYSTFHGCNDTIPLEETAKVAGSLRLIAVEELTIEVFFARRSLWELQAARTGPVHACGSGLCVLGN